MPIVLKCPVCRGKFRYDVSEGWPDYCQIPDCKAFISNARDEDDVVVPNILSFKTKNNDKVARDIMDGSETRAELAAQMAGTSVDEMSSLKITNLNDRNDAEHSAVTVRNEVTQRMDAMQAVGLPTGFGTNAADAMARAAASHTGDAPYAGLRSMKNLQSKLSPIGQAPLPLQITNNPNYRSPV
jgi:hypothetical protein